MESIIDNQPGHKWGAVDGRDVIELHVPEYKQSEMHVTLSNGKLTVTGDRNSIDSDPERVKFTKTFRINKECRPQDIKAKLTNGYLSIILPPNARDDRTEDHKGYGYDSWLAINLSELSFDKRLAAKAATAIIVVTSLAVGVYLAFSYLHYT